MNEILNYTYNELRAHGLGLSERQFSKKFLGKCETYFAYLKSGGHQVSNDALLSLWSHLNAKRREDMADMNKATSKIYRGYLERRIHVLGSLSQDVFKEIENQHMTE